jgi:asparagine synthase (glutamine-hydrolysing)
MLDLQQHRGPDDAGIWSCDGIALGNRRLAILDLSPAGHQPMLSPDGDLAVVQNGEIYNFRELKRELEARGHHFASHCDTEVLLIAYKEWGPEFVEKLRGMFAIALWDLRRRSLLLARDRFGIKPLHYCYDEGARQPALWFASEIKPVVAARGKPVAPDLAVLHDFLAFSLLDHTDATFFEGVRKVPPAHYLLIDGDGRVQMRRYWDFEVSDDLDSAGRTRDADFAEQFRARFSEAVEYHLVSDVPVGSCLSGGLDSSAIVCEVRRLWNRAGADGRAGEHWTYTSSFDDPQCDERWYAREVIAATGAKPHWVFPTVEGLLEDLPAMVHHLEEPFGGPSVYAQWCVMRAIHESGMKVVLDGQGADEFLLGYAKFYAFYLKHLRWRRRWRRLVSEATGLALSPGFWRTFDLRNGLRYLGRTSEIGRETALLSPALGARHRDRRAGLGLSGNLAQRLKDDVVRFSLPVLLRYEDRTSMAFSVESRVPFLDHPLAEFMAQLPLNQKLRHGWTKLVLREALTGILPDAVRRRRSKFGFNTPEESWMRKGMAAHVAEVFQQARCLGEWADMPKLREAYRKYRSNRSPHPGRLFFRYYVTEMWARQFLLGDVTFERARGSAQRQSGFTMAARA